MKRLDLWRWRYFDPVRKRKINLKAATAPTKRPMRQLITIRIESTPPDAPLKAYWLTRNIREGDMMTAIRKSIQAHRGHMEATRHRTARWIAGLAAATAMGGCASNALTDPDGIGTGSYFQVVERGVVVMERDTAQVGRRNCQHFARYLLQDKPGLKGNVRCADKPSGATLPYSIVILLRHPDAFDLARSEPQTVRFLTPELCRSSIPKADAPFQPVSVNCGTKP